MLTASDLGTNLDAPMPKMNPDDISPDAAMRLFCAVIFQTFKDACETPTRRKVRKTVKSGKNKGKRRTAAQFAEANKDADRKYESQVSEMKSARAFLTTRNLHFDRLCVAAGMDPDYVFDKAQAAKSAGWKLPTMSGRITPH